MKFGADTLAEICEMMGKYTLAEICEKTGMTRNQVRGLLQRNNISTRDMLKKSRMEKFYISNPCRICGQTKGKDICECPVWTSWYKDRWRDMQEIFANVR